MADPYNLTRSSEGIEAIRRIAARPGRVLILMQNNPDADAIASAAALRYLIRHLSGKRAVLGYAGICGRAENQAMLKVLHIDAHRLTPEQLAKYKILCLVDTQPRFGNNALFTTRPVDIVIDHHLRSRRARWTAEWTDVRPVYGSTSTIFYEYLLAAGVHISADLATALFYGIQSDTLSLGREACAADRAAYVALFNVVDQRKLAQIHRAPVTRSYFTMLHESLESCVLAGRTVISSIRTCENPDMIAEVADLMLRMDSVRASVCYGRYGDRILLSARAADARGNAYGGMRRIVKGWGTGGGHRTMAGGQIPIVGDPEAAMAEVHARILAVFAAHHPPEPLIPESKD